MKDQFGIQIIKQIFKDERMMNLPENERERIRKNYYILSR